MKIEHFAMYVIDLEAVKDFLCVTSMQSLITCIITRKLISSPTFYLLMMAPDCR